MAQNVPTINTSKIRNNDINIGTCFFILLILDNKHIGIRKVDKTTNGSEIPSTPIWYEILEKGTHCAFSTNWKLFKSLSKLNKTTSDKIKVIKLVHKATIFEFFAPWASSEQVSKITKAPKSGRKVKKDKINLNKDFYVFTGSTVGVVPILSKGTYIGKIDKLGTVKAVII